MSEQHPQPSDRPESVPGSAPDAGADVSLTKAADAAAEQPAGEQPSAGEPAPDAAAPADPPAAGAPVPGPPPAPGMPVPPGPPPAPGYVTPPGHLVDPWAAPVPPKAGTGKILAIVLSAVVCFLLVAGGCAVLLLNTHDDHDNGPDRTPAAAPGPDGGTTPAAPAEEPTHDETAALDEPVTYPNGITIALSGFRRGVSSSIAAPSDTPYVKFTIKMTNDTNATLDASQMTLVCQHGDQGMEGEQVFDRGLSGVPESHVRPGRSVTAVVACAMPKDDTYLQVEVSPTWETDAAVFAGKIE